jgi:Cd2+/Zn2+-exporting ATPase
MITQTPSLKILATKIGGINWGNCAKTVEAGLQNLPGSTEINLVFPKKVSVEIEPGIAIAT